MKPFSMAGVTAPPPMETVSKLIQPRAAADMVPASMVAILMGMLNMAMAMVRLSLPVL